MKKTAIVISLIMLILALAGHADANNNGEMISLMWERQAANVEQVMGCLKKGRTYHECEEFVFDIASAETNLMAYGVDPGHPELVSRLANGLKLPADFRKFAFRIFKSRLKKATGHRYDPVKPFSRGSFDLRSRTGSFSGVASVNIY